MDPQKLEKLNKLKESRSVQALRRSKGRFLVPNAITALSLILGIVTIVMALKGNLVPAGWTILLCAILDRLDGPTARALDASSAFGGEMDSFADYTAFGVAPAILVFSSLGPSAPAGFSLQGGEEYFLYAAVILWALFAAMRLARFNITSVPNNPYMIGMPAPAAGTIVITILLIGLMRHDYGYGLALLGSIPYFMIFFALMMISRIPSLKNSKGRGWHSQRFEQIATLVIFFLVVTRMLPEILFLLAIIYIVLAFGWPLFHRERVQEELRALGMQLDAQTHQVEEVEEFYEEEDLSDDPEETNEDGKTT